MKKLIILFFISGFAFAQWSQKSINIFMEQTSKFNSIKDTSMATLWGGTQRSMTFPYRKGDLLTVKSKLFKEGEFKVYAYKTKKKAPLVVLLPGIFGSYNSEVTKATVRKLEAIDVHLLVQPNFLNFEYISFGPLYEKNKADAYIDLQAAKESIDQFIQVIGLENINGIHFVGESLGTYIASSLYATYSKHNNEVQNGSLTLICPPLKLSVAMENFDKLISAYAGDDNACSIFYNYPMMAYYMVYKDLPGEIPEETSSCLKNYLYKNIFLNMANKSIEAFYESRNKESKPDVKDFSDFFIKYQPDFYKMLTENHDQTILATWLKLATDSGRKKIRIISSTNDFVNNPDSWDGFFESTGLTKDQMLMLPWGGHCAYFGTKNWEQIFENEFEIKKGTL